MSEKKEITAVPMRSQIESGAELLARLSGKPSLHTLDDKLFPEGLKSTDIVEIGGESSTGKTLLLSQTIGKCILPSFHRNINIHGCDASAILINTDHHFQISKLVELMTTIVRDATASSCVDFETIDGIVRNSLRNLLVVDCYCSEQLLLTLRTLDDFFLSNPNVALIAIDGILAYYWQDRETNSAWSLDSYVGKLLNLIKAHTSRFNVATIYTRPRDVDRVEKLTKNLDCRIRLHQCADVREFVCITETARSVRKMNYSICQSGIKWKVEGSKG